LVHPFGLIDGAAQCSHEIFNPARLAIDHFVHLSILHVLALKFVAGAPSLR
jgi:hypothetical protein